jgi:mannose-6-phosphate isomerase-like protein (cupin superfamily)
MPFIGPQAMIEVAPLAGWSGRFFHSTNMTFGHWEIAADATDLHHHHHEQEEVWNVVSGAILLVIDGTERRLEAGDAAAVPSNVSHAARVIGACRAIVVDYPLRLELPTPHRG